MGNLAELRFSQAVIWDQLTGFILLFDGSEKYFGLIHRESLPYFLESFDLIAYNAIKCNVVQCAVKKRGIVKYQLVIIILSFYLTLLNLFLCNVYDF